MIRIGSHVPAAAPLAGMAQRDGDIVQLHLSAPLQWRAPLARADSAELAASGAVSTVHAPYLCNPASADDEVRERTATVLQQTLDAAETVGAGGVVVHAGHATDGADLEVAIERWVALAQRLRSPVPLLIENTATGAAAAGRTLGQWSALFEALRGAALDIPVAGCLDTCHAFAGDPDAAADPEQWSAAAIGAAGAVPVLHVNDSLAGPGGRRDLHANLGAGEAGRDWLERFVRTCVEHGVSDLLVETPGRSEAQSADIAWLRSVLDC
jgi:deoxyribonuclease-4